MIPAHLIVEKGHPTDGFVVWLVNNDSHRTHIATRDTRKEAVEFAALLQRVPILIH